MALSKQDVQRLNMSMPVANDVKLGDLLKSLESAGGAEVSVAWADVKNKPSTFPPATHTHAIADITNLQTTLNDKLTASKAATQADSTAADVAGLVADFNALLAKLKDAGIMS
ncbi:head fiber protein [Terribacillus sp. 179-K 1B1 HS]|uniref:head fiber protein n=1 Tax=Terribacillus sp. 179-K 1B1 HS TaxID=3142388 RepID=UPI0039A1541A